MDFTKFNQLNNFDLSSLSPSAIQDIVKMAKYIQDNMDKVKKLIITDPEFKTQESLDIINEFGAIKYPNKSYLDRQNLVREELKEIMPALKDTLGKLNITQ